ncbi:MAG: aldehyde dehydrogenase [Clostridia bacterium]|jgi:aldehyde dehydrogenase (NAD+)|nr:aldehyde dehydrogenase [Clostridia bacterium]
MNNTSLDIHQLLEEHRRYFDKGETKSVDFRLKQLDILLKAIKRYEKEIQEALYKDLHKPEFEAYATEIGFLYDSIKYFKKNIANWAKPRSVKTPIYYPMAKSIIYKEPYGTVLIIGPFNYPFQLVIEPLLGAIAAGNCAVLKPSEYTPNITAVIKKVIEESFDKSYIRVLEGEREATSTIINAPFDYIFFTGSVGVGKVVMEAAGRNLVPVTLELGGKSPCIVDRSADIDAAAQRIAWGKFLNTGQTCVAPDYVMAHKDIKQQFIQALIQQLKQFYGDKPLISKDYGRIVSGRHMQRLLGLLDKSKIVYGGEYELEHLYMAPTIMDNISWRDKVMEDEIFGPILPILEFEDVEEVIKTINSRHKPLALYVFAEDRAIWQRIIENTTFGGGCVNDTISHLASPYLPFGGVGSSGIGSYHGKKSFDTFTHEKSVLVKPTHINLKFLYPPYSQEKLKLLKRFLK